MWQKSKPWSIVLAVILVSVLGCSAYLFFRSPTKRGYDPLMQALLARVAGVSSYAQHVQTTNVSPEGILHITGDYLVDDADKQYFSYSTTTYMPTGGTPVVFLVENRSIGGDVYLRLTNKTPKIRLAVPATGNWQHFPASNIPSTYQNIAVAGPVIDDLKLLGYGGSYLSKTNTVDKPSILGKTEFIRYTFKLSRLAETANDASIKTIANRIGTDGLIDLWINASSTDLGYMRLTNGSSYTSTTTFSRLNEAFDIGSPVN